MIVIPSGTYQIGTNDGIGAPTDKEGPKTSVTIAGFYIDETTVTNQAFQTFVEETGYITEAEKFGWSFVFHYFLDDETKKKSKLVPGLSWWYGVVEANWRQPEGPNSDIRARMDHPVTQVSRNDAVAYCQWSGKRLPTEAEWEVAARGTSDSDLFPWGNEFLANNQYHANIWQGEFPKTNSLDDGYAGTAPVKTYETNSFGLYQMLGNVWEWCVNERGTDLVQFDRVSGREYWEKFQEIDDAAYATRGGSFLCHQSYCNRYRIAARNGNTGMSASNNVGFRCVKELT